MSYKDHPEYLELGIFAGYGEFEKETSMTCTCGHEIWQHEGKCEAIECTCQSYEEDCSTEEQLILPPEDFVDEVEWDDLDGEDEELE